MGHPDGDLKWLFGEVVEVNCVFIEWNVDRIQRNPNILKWVKGEEPTKRAVAENN